MRRLLISFCLLLALSGWAANKCVGPSATGDGSGDDWNKLKAWSDTPTRGDTWYLRNGSYAGKQFSTAVSGGTVITIKKATVADHGGINTGWDDAYAGAATFAGSISFTTSDWVFDGVNGGGPGSWKTGFGFVIDRSGGSDGAGFILVQQAGTLGNIVGKHFSVIGHGDDAEQSPAQDLIWTGTNTSGLTISYSYLYDSGRCILFYRGNNITNEYIYTGKFESTAGQHAEIASIGENAGGTIGMSTNVVFRYSVFTHSEGTGGLMMMGENLIIYGCVFAPLDGNSLGGGNGVAGGWTDIAYPISMKLYNNSFIDTATWVVGILENAGKTGEFKNNLVYSSELYRPYLEYLTHTYNHYIDVTTWGGEVTVTEATSTTADGDPFTDWANLDFSLVVNTTSGTDLGSPYNQDMLGNTRTSWTRGAIEYDSDVTDPVISAVSTTSTNDVGATIGWTTDELSTSIVFWGLNDSVTNGASTNGSYVSSHSITLSGLASDTVYYSRVMSVDGSGNSSTSNNPAVFRTLTTDSLAPTNTLTAPTNGATISGTFAITATATDNVGVVGVKFYYDTTLLGDDTSNPYSYNWNTLLVTNGAYTVWSVARDARTNLTYSATNSVTVTNDYSPPAITEPLYWPMNEGSGAFTADNGGSTNSLMLSNGAAWTTGKWGYGIALDGVNDWLTAPDSPALAISSNALTVTCWVKLTNNNAEWFQIVGKPTDDAGAYATPFWDWHLFAQTNSATLWSPAFQLRNAAETQQYVQTATPLPYGVWTHLAGTYDGTNLALFVNGEEVASVAHSGNILYYGKPLHVGITPLPSELMKGVLDELRIYPEALTAGTVQSLYEWRPSLARVTTLRVGTLRVQ